MTGCGSQDAPGAVLLDIDGTLVDSNYVHVTSWLHAFQAEGRHTDAWRIHRAVGMGSPQLLATLLGEESEHIGSRMTQRHSEYYLQMSSLLRPFDGARELVSAVASRGARTMLVSSAAPAELGVLRSILNVGESVAEIVAAKDVGAAKPEPDLVEVALDRAGVPPDRAVFVGDTVWDVQACARAGVGCVCLLSGGISAAELGAAGALAVYEDCRALLDELDASPLATLWAS